MTLEFGDIILFTNNDLIGNLIKWHTNSKWTHAAIALGSYDFLIEATYPKVREVKLYEEYKDSKYIILRLNQTTINTPFTNRDISTGFEFLKNQIGKPYDLRGFISFLLNKKIGNKNYYFCSELVWELYNLLNKKITREESDFFCPGDIYDSLAFDIIRGDI